MPSPFRILVAILSAAATYLFCYWVILALLPGGTRMSGVAWVMAILLGFATGLFVWRHAVTVDAGLATQMIRWGLIVGGAGFLAGFIGPIVFTPSANQGPLLGLFVTGPLGLVLGGGFGALRWYASRRDARPPR